MRKPFLSRIASRAVPLFCYLGLWALSFGIAAASLLGRAAPGSLPS
jgi:hypothetical protein